VVAWNVPYFKRGRHVPRADNKRTGLPSVANEAFITQNGCNHLFFEVNTQAQRHPGIII
jgi:hypothetical protein